MIFAKVRGLEYKFIYVGDTKGRSVPDKIFRLMFAERSKGDTVEYIRIPYSESEIEMFQRQSPYEKAQRRKRANIIADFHKALYSGKKFGDVLVAEEKAKAEREKLQQQLKRERDLAEEERVKAEVVAKHQKDLAEKNKKELEEKAKAKIADIEKEKKQIQAKLEAMITCPFCSKKFSLNETKGVK